MEKYCPKCFKKFSGQEVRCPADGKKLVSMVDRDLVGQELDERYKVLSLLGRGGMGVVYVAEQAMIGRRVALKVLRREVVQDETTVKRFLTEAKAIASLRNPHTVTLHDFGITDDGLLYYTMELLEGRPLSKVIVGEGPLDYERAARLLSQVLESLEEAHEKGILHRDLKPDNLFVSVRRGVEHVTVLDFGIAKLAGDTSMESITRTGMICGTPAYLAPEQALGNPAVPASDLYSLAIVFYEMLAGLPPFHDTTPMKLLLQQLNAKPVPISVRNPKVQVPASIDAFLQKALEKEPESRFTSVVSFREGLERALEVHRLAPTTASLLPMESTSDGLRGLKGVSTGETHDYAARSEAGGTARPQGPVAAVSKGLVDPGVTTGDASAGAAPEGPTGQGTSGTGTASTAALEKAAGMRSTLGKWLAVGALALACGVGLLVWNPWSGADPQSSGGEVVTPEAQAPYSPTPVPAAGTPAQDRALEEANRARQDAEAMARAQEEARRQAEEKVSATAGELVRLKAEADAARKQAEAAHARADEEARLKGEAEAKARAAEDAGLKAQADATARAAEEARLKALAEEKAQAATSSSAAAAGRKPDAKKTATVEKGSPDKTGSSTAGTTTKAVEPAKEEGSGFGFRPVEVDDSKGPTPESGDDGGFGFRPVEVK